MIRASRADARPKSAIRNGGNDKAMKALQRYQMSKAEKAALKAEIARQVHELDEKFSAEICAMLLWALHEEFGFGADRLRRVWNCVAVHRAELLKHYDMQDNAEFILLYKLRQIGVDVEKWTAEPQTQKVVLKE